MSEIKTSDLQEIKTPERQGFQDIHPQKGMTPLEANRIWDSEITELKHQDTSSDIYTDDNGREYRIGENLIPDNTYDINGYSYKTDSEGRISFAEGKLRLRSPEYVRNMKDSLSEISKGDERVGDERGHVIAFQFGGGNNLENIVPMSKELNHGDYAKMENELADAVKDGADVRLKVEPVYDGNSHRPTEFRIAYSIDGDISVKVFRNGGSN